MTALGWLAAGAAVLLAAGPLPHPDRAGRLAAAARLAAPPGTPARVGAVPPPQVAAAAVVVAVLGIGYRLGPALGLAAAAVALCGWVLARDVRRRRTAAAAAADLGQAVRVLVGELEAGARPAAALAAAAAIAPAQRRVLRAAADEAADGGDAGAVLGADPQTRALGLAWQVGHGSGAALGAVLGRVADDLAAAAEQRQAVGVALSGPRASAAVLSGLPALGLVLGGAMGARPWSFLVGSPAGRAVACLGILFDVAGVCWMRRILHAAGRP